MADEKKDKPEPTVDIEKSDELMYNLKEAGKILTIKDMNYTFSYSQAPLPDKKESKYYTLSYKEDGDPLWHMVNGLLTDDFTVCRTEKAIAEISKSLSGELIGEKHWRDKTAVKSTFLIKGYTLDITEVSDADKIIFQLLTGVSINEIEQKSALAFHIINGFSGNLALRLNYGFITSQVSDGDDPKKMNISNIFLLDEFSHRLVHNGKLDIEYSKVDDVKKAVGAKVELFKLLIPDVMFMDGLKNGFQKKFVKKFFEIFDALPIEYKNMYYVSHIMSAMLENIKQINKEIFLRKYISAHVDRLDTIRIAEIDSKAAKESNTSEIIETKGDDA